VLHHLSAAQKAGKDDLRKRLLRMLARQETGIWHEATKLDKSWFYLFTNHEFASLAPGESVPQRERHMIQSSKLMGTVTWIPSGFQVVITLPKGTKFRASYYITEMLESTKELLQTEGEAIED
jgi:hypothetical protein